MPEGHEVKHTNSDRAIGKDATSLTRREVIDLMIRERMSSKGEKVKNEHDSIIEYIVGDGALDKFSNTDPFYDPNVNLFRMYNGGVITEVNKTITYVQILPFQTLIKDIIASSPLKPGTDNESYLMLPRIDVTNELKRKAASLKKGEEITVGFQEKNKMNVPVFKRKKSDNANKVVSIPGASAAGSTKQKET
tara:strand:+ start:1753 stop:2328 length:576 start_codon:yes stop_codon:yes gene_type:complete